MSDKRFPAPSPENLKRAEGHQPIIVNDGHQPFVEINKGHQPLVTPGRANTGHQPLPSADPPAPPPATGSLAKPPKK